MSSCLIAFVSTIAKDSGNKRPVYYIILYYIYIYIYIRLHGEMDGWMDRWIYGWIDGYKYIYTHAYIDFQVDGMIVIVLGWMLYLLMLASLSIFARLRRQRSEIDVAGGPLMMRHFPLSSP